MLGITWSAVEGMKLEPVAGAMGAGQVVEGGGEVVVVSGGLGAGCRPTMLIALVFVSFFLHHSVPSSRSFPFLVASHYQQLF